MEIVNIKLSKLKPYEKNAKLHPEDNIEAIKKSIKKYGFADPIGVWGKQNIIVEGHGRYLACKELGIEEVPCIRLDHLTDEERREYTLLHNKTTLMSDFDIDLLGEELLELDLSEFDLDWGIVQDEIFDESDLDDGRVKENVIVSINCKNVEDYNSIKEKLQNLVDEIGATLSVKMQ